jgi:hypothetical protein
VTDQFADAQLALRAALRLIALLVTSHLFFSNLSSCPGLNRQ